MADDTKNQPNFTSKAYSAMECARTIVCDVADGTLALRGESKDKRTRSATYLIPEPKESQDNFNYRRATAILFNATARTLHGLVGMVFRKEPTLQDDVPEIIRGKEASEGESAIEGLAENMDNCGTHWTVFSKELFTDAMRDGHALVLADAPPLPKRADGLPANREDVKISGWRPYWVSYKADQILNWRTAVIDGRTQLMQLTLKECSMEPDGDYGEKEVNRYRVLRPGRWDLYEEAASTDGQKTYEWKIGGDSGLSEIPVAVVYSRKINLLESAPPLLDLALINVAHYQKYSDFSTYIKMCKPVLWFRNRDKSSKVEPIGPFTFFEVTGDNGLVAFAEPTGAALEQTRQDIKDLEAQMAALGISIIAGKSPQPNTATEEILDHVQEESDLATAARSLKDCLELALKYLMQFIDSGATSGGSVELGATIEELTLAPQEMREYGQYQANGQMCLETLWSVLGRANKLPVDFDPEKEKAAIAAETKERTEAAMKQFDGGFGRPNLGESGDDNE